MVRFSIEELGLSQFRICQDLSGKYFIQELVEKGGFWSFTGHIKKEWLSLRTKHADIIYYDILEHAVAEIERILNLEIQKISQDEGKYDVIGACLCVELDDTLGVLALRKRLDNGV